MEVAHLPVLGLCHFRDGVAIEARHGEEVAARAQVRFLYRLIHLRHDARTKQY
mgnify:CR=1 FL=1